MYVAGQAPDTEAGAGGDLGLADWLATERSCRVEAGPDGPTIPFGDRSFLASFAVPFRPGQAAELARVAERYVVVGGERLGHRRLIESFSALGFRPLAREAELLWLRPWWVYAFMRRDR